ALSARAPAGVRRVRSPGSGRRPGVHLFRETSAGHARVVSRAAKMDSVVSARGRRPGCRRDGLVRPAIARHRLSVRGPGGEPIYEALCAQDGIHLPSGETRARQSAMRVERAIRRDVEPFSPQVTAAVALENLRQLGAAAWPVADGDDLIGMITAAQLEGAVDQGASNRPLAQILP